jgi:iron complex outermembrane recepter protein
MSVKAAALCSASLVTLCTVAPLFSTLVHAETIDLPGVTIYSTTPQIGSRERQEQTPPAASRNVQPEAASTSVEDPASPLRPPVAGDAGEFLHYVNGVDISRMGGHGLEPSMHGMDQNQLSVTNDGAFHFGGCPNRMDPPTSHMQLYTFDMLTVTKGYQTVMDGPPAPGGTIEFERVNPDFSKSNEFQAHVKAGAGYNSNGDKTESFVDMSMGSAWGYVRAFGSLAMANNYEDGDGKEVRSSFDQSGGGFIIGRTFDANSWITFKVENNNVDDVLYPGAGMDAPMTEDWTYQFKGETDLNWGVIRGVKGDVYLTTVDHVMNNFDLRTPPAGSMNMEARTESDTFGGKLVFNALVSGVSIDFGADYRDVMRDGRRYAGPLTNYNPSMVQSVLWPDTSIKEAGLFTEAQIPFSERTKLVTGLRYAHVDASANDADVVATGGGGNLSANDLYKKYYGIEAEDQTENNISALARLEHKLTSDLTVFSTLSRAVRTADATERWIAAKSAKASDQWIGNPEIDPEKHHQIDLGLMYHTPMLDLKGSVYYNKIEDFIQYDTARGRRGVIATDLASVYTNIDATIAGVEGEANVRLNDYWRVNLAAAYTYGQNESDDIPLAQIAPLSGRLELIYDAKRWSAGVRLNAASEQDRVDTDKKTGSGRDYANNDGHLTVDLFGSYNITENFQISAGVTNVFDETYANYLNRTNLLDPRGIQVNEPGRSFYIRSVTQF